MKLIIGLGNPGKEYLHTRHNIGFFIIDEYLKETKWSKNEFADFFKTEINNQKVIFIKPSTYMNLSGNAVRYFINYYKIDIKDILIIQDDLDIELGSYKLKTNSTSGGHNGIQSIIDNLGTNSFLRLKIGIGKPLNNNTIDYVLDKFSKEDLSKIESNQKLFNSIITDFIKDKSTDILMNTYNGTI